MKILIATTNPGKFREIQNLLLEDDSPFELVSLADLNIKTPYSETGSTFLENASGKSLYYSSLASDMLTVGEDSGLTVEALGGEPGIHSARYAGPDANNDKNIGKLLDQMKSLDNRRAAFVAMVVLSRNGRLLKTFQGRVEGLILRKKEGSGGFGYDPVFYYTPAKRTFARLTVSEKNRVSHRAKAFRQLKQYLNIHHAA